MSKEMETLENLISTTCGGEKLLAGVKKTVLKLEEIRDIVNLPPSNGYFESVRDCIDKYNLIKNILGSDEE